MNLHGPVLKKRMEEKQEKETQTMLLERLVLLATATAAECHMNN